MATDTKFYAVKLADGTWWKRPTGMIAVYTSRKSAAEWLAAVRGADRMWDNPPVTKGARVVRVRLVEETSQK